MILHDVEQGSLAWFQIRCGIPTASEFSRLVTGTGKPSTSLPGYANELAAEKFAGKPMSEFDGNAWMDRGKEKEAEAIAFYEFTNDVTVARVGFCTLDDGSAGCSPDGLIGEDGGLEIKCLKAESHVEVVTYHKKHGVCPPKYAPQVQGSLLITGRKYWEQFFYHPDLPPLIVRTVPDMAFQTMLADAIREVCRQRDTALEQLRRDQTHVPDGRDMLGAG